MPRTGVTLRTARLAAACFALVAVAPSEPVPAASGGDVALDAMFAEPPVDHGVLFDVVVDLPGENAAHRARVESNGRTLMVAVEAPPRVAGDRALIHHGHVFHRRAMGAAHLRRGSLRQFRDEPAVYYPAILFTAASVHHTPKDDATGEAKVVLGEQSAHRIFETIRIIRIAENGLPREAIFESANAGPTWRVSYSYAHTLTSSSGEHPFPSSLTLARANRPAAAPVRITISEPTLVPASRIATHLP